MSEFNDEENQGEEVTPDYYKKEIEKVFGHYYPRLNKQSPNEITLRFKVKWLGYNFVSYDEWQSFYGKGEQAKGKFGDYIRSLPARPKSTLIKRYPQLVTLLKQ